MYQLCGHGIIHIRYTLLGYFFVYQFSVDDIYAHHTKHQVHANL